MKEYKSKKIAHSPESRERMQLASKIRHEFVKIKIYKDVRQTMRLIEEEIGGNEGIYLKNRGRVSLAEIARRAKIHPVTLHRPNYSDLIVSADPKLTS